MILRVLPEKRSAKVIIHVTVIRVIFGIPTPAEEFMFLVKLIHCPIFITISIHVYENCRFAKINFVSSIFGPWNLSHFYPHISKGKLFCSEQILTNLPSQCSAFIGIMQYRMKIISHYTTILNLL